MLCRVIKVIIIVSKDISLALDLAASRLFDNNSYILQKDKLSSKQLVEKLIGSKINREQINGF